MRSLGLYLPVAVVLLSALLSGLGAVAELPPAPPVADARPIEGFAFAHEDAARAAVRPMYETRPAEPVAWGETLGLHLPCNLAGTPMPRASWDFRVPLDLADKRGIQFHIYCPNLKPVARFVCYFRSGKGWYTADFEIPSPNQWHRVRIDKMAVGVEGEPRGWGDIDLVRLSAWRGADEDTSLHVSQVAYWGARSPLVLVSGDYAAQAAPGEAKTVQACRERCARLLDGMGLSFAPLSDMDLDAGTLEGKEVALLPYNPALPPGAVEALSAFVENGGKLLAFYQLPGSLAELVGLGPAKRPPAPKAGTYARIRAAGEGLVGMPEETGQRSWNIHVREFSGEGRVAAYWHDEAGENTGFPAVSVTPQAVYMSHILLGDDPAKKRMLLLAMLGELRPAVWTESTDWHVKHFAETTPFESVAAAGEAAAASGRPEVVAAFEQALGRYDTAKELAAAGSEVEAILVATQAASEFTELFCLVQAAQPDEHRAFWCHNARGVPPMTWDESIALLAESGFNAIIPNMLWGGVAFYPSEVLPVSSVVAEEGDQVAQCLAACKKYGVACHVWKVNWNMGHPTPKAFVSKMRAAGRVQQSFDGSSEERWLCPSHPENQALEIAAMAEVAQKYDVDGIHFDYIRYPGPDGCFCAGCRERFEAALGEKVADWPGGVRADPALEAQWFEFRRVQITRVVAEVNRLARAARPGIEISAAVFTNWPQHRDSIGQDCKRWCDEGYLDFVCPMDYTPHTAQFREQVRQQLDWSGSVPCYPGIGLSTWADGGGVVRLIRHIGVTRQLGTGGFTVFNYGAGEAAEVLPRCALGITRPQTPSSSPHETPKDP